MVKKFVDSVEFKLEESSPKKTQRTGNVVLDRINSQIEGERELLDLPGRGEL